ncbi:response regulator transcription factor [Niallia taxi]|uniref:response regulator transcription factor n=1 Tax=Niallia taxi TaxID=2499688 RepID=UPI0023A98AA8|nr:response regulator transcription factor [Niallia taxi]MDE5053421.1 response regulator transcription factor [Niallia taxi]WOD61234.1 response regulator transcription factor [Niallia taxi]
MAIERGRLLIVDDEILIRQGIKHYINWEQEGFEIVGEAAHGKEALELIEVVKPDIILTDIVMPIMDGEELTRILKEQYPQIGVIVLSSFGDFDYVRSTFQNGVLDYILKPKLNSDSLLTALRKMKQQIAGQKLPEKNEGNSYIEQSIRKMLSGYDIEKHCDKIAAIFPAENYWLAAIQTTGEQVHMDTFKTEIISGLKGRGFTCFMEKDIAIINGNNVQQLQAFFEGMASEHMELRVVLTDSFDDFTLIGKHYKDTLVKLINTRFYFPEIPVLTTQVFSEKTPELEAFHLDWFISEFKGKRFDTALSYVEEYAANISSNFMLDVYEYKSFFSNIIFNITILLGNMEYDVKKLEQEKYTYLRGIEEAATADQVGLQLQRFLIEAKRTIDVLLEQPDSINIKRIISYLNEHFQEQLTLTNVANHFHFNPSYLSSYFSTHMKEGFSEYLNRIRIEEASKLLTAGTEPISEISGIVGYSDHSYFCKVFKKMKGLSPSQFRRKQWVEK